MIQFITQFGNSLGRCRYYLVTNTAVFELSYLDYENCVEFNFQPYCLCDSETQNKVWDCWKAAGNAAEVIA